MFQSNPLGAAQNNCGPPSPDVFSPGQSVPWGLNSSESKHWLEILLQSLNLLNKHEHTGTQKIGNSNQVIIQIKTLCFNLPGFIKEIEFKEEGYLQFSIYERQYS